MRSPIMQLLSRVAALGMLAAAAASPVARAQPYPSRPIQFIVPYSAGGAADLAARALAQSAQKHLDQPIVVANRVGGNGVVGSQVVLNAEKDGHTLLIARVGSHAVGPALDKSFPFTWNSFAFLGMLEIDPYVCVVGKDSPYRTLADLVGAVRAAPGKLTFATSGTVDTSVVFPVRIMLRSGLKTDAITPVPYKGGGETLNAVLSGQVNFACSPLAPYATSIRAGSLRALVVSTHARVAGIDAPTAQEVGMPELETMSGWTALYGPPGLPQAIVDRWTSVLGQVKSDPDWARQVRARGSEPAIMSPADTGRFVESQFKAYAELAPMLGIRK